MFILVIYSRLVTLHLTIDHSNEARYMNCSAVYHKLKNLIFDA